MKRTLAVVAVTVAAALGVLAPVGSAGAISGGSIAPTTLSSAGQAIQVTYSGKNVVPAQGGSNQLWVSQCIASDSKPGFDPLVDCSSLSEVPIQNVTQTSGTVTYGGNPQQNPYAPFVGAEPANGEWSVCDPNSGVTNYQSGFFRLADAPDDQADDYFVAFTCGSPEVPEAPLVALLPLGAAGVLVGAYFIVRNRKSAQPTAAA